MSYRRIMRRINRIVKATIHDAMDRLTREEQELADFDEELRRAASSASRKEEDRSRTAGPAGTGARTGSSGAGGEGRQTGGTRAKGARKPGEKDDAYYYAVLGVNPHISDEELRKTYRSLMRTYHPDRVSSISAERQAEAAEKAKCITEAYHILMRRRRGR
ncbi:MAG: J domain-containing protein [Bacteroidota bacterium]|nr:J domain-containing protein [Bacteroidota bacterium]